VFKNNSNNFISNIKETVDDRQLEAHNRSFTTQEAFNFKDMKKLRSKDADHFLS
jgi:hypothetical protein